MRRLHNSLTRLGLFFSMVIGLSATDLAAQNLRTSVASPGQSSVLAGTNISYEFNVTNIGLLTATSAVLNVTLPAGIRHVANTGGCSVAGALVSCPLGNMSLGVSRDITITLHVNDNFVETSGAGFVNFSATATSDGSPTANTVVGDTPVTESADLQITNATTDTSPRAGESFIYTIYVDNWGPSTARNVVITDTLLNSEDVSIQSCAFSVSQGGGTITQFTCTTGAVVETQFGTGIGTFRTNVLDSLAIIVDDPSTPGVDESAVLGRLRASFRLVANEDMTVITDARTFSDTPDPDPTNNQQLSAVINVEAVADLSLDIGADAELQPDGTAALPYDLLSGDAFPDAAFDVSNIAVTAGRRIQYSYTVTNSGVSDADGTALTAYLPGGVVPVPGTLNVTYGDGSAAPGSCQFGTPGNPSSAMTCSLGIIDADTTFTGVPSINQFNVRVVSFDVMVGANVSSGTLLVNNVLLGSDTLDTDNSDNLGASLMVVSPLTGISGCSVGGPYTNVLCANGAASIGLNGFGFSLPEAGPLGYQWTTTCPDASFDDDTSASPQLSFTTVNLDNSPVSCQVDLTVQNSFATSSCSGVINVVECSVDCLGAVGGLAQLDRCGVCQGDGNSCLGCTDTDTSNDLAALTRSALSLRQLTIRAARKLTDVKAVRTSIRRARQDFSNTLNSISEVPAVIRTCTNAAFCVQTSNTSSLDAINDSLSIAQTRLERTVRKLRRQSGDPKAAKSISRRGKSVLNGAQAALVRVPVSSSSCS